MLPSRLQSSALPVQYQPAPRERSNDADVEMDWKMRDIAFGWVSVLQKSECCQKRVRPLLDHLEGLLDLGHDLRRIHRPDIRNFPYLDRLPDRIYPILAEAVVLTQW